MIVDKEILNACENLKDDEKIYDLCKRGVLYNKARADIYHEIAEIAYDPYMYAESLGWDISRPSKKQEECISLNITFNKEDVIDAMVTFGEALKKHHRSWESACYDDDYQDAISNIVAKRFKETLDYCGVKIWR